VNNSYSFDAAPNRHGTNCIKYDRLNKDFGTNDVIPLWVADMDFATPDFIMDAIRSKCDQQVLGYPVLQDGWYTSIRSWLKKRYEWDVQNEEIGFVPGIVAGFALCIQCFTNPGDKVLIQTPVYPPFMHVPKNNGRELIINELLFNNNRFEINWSDFEEKVASNCKLFILCSPHNPGGRIWSKEELSKMLNICQKHNVLIVSDEIHADLTLPGFKHTPAATLCLPATTPLITLMAPSKTFNIPGLNSSFFVIQQPEIRAKYQKFLAAAELSNGNIFAYIAPEAAYTKGEDWLRQLTEYLQENVDYVDRYLQAHIPQIKVCRPEASFLIWLDCRELGLDSKNLSRFFIEKAKLGLNPGDSFGPGGEGFMRLNIGCPREILCQALLQLKEATDTLLS
jgi:cysteine-S-conjugate beta-lyase